MAAARLIQLRSLLGEHPCVSSLGRPVDLLKDELTDPHPGFQANDVRPDIEDLKLQAPACPVGLLLGVSEASMDGWSCNVDAQAEPGQAALSLHARGNLRALGQPDYLLGPTKDKLERRKVETFGTHRE